jgi:hypothetical protein
VEKRRDRQDEAAADIFSIVLLSHLNVMLNFAIKAIYNIKCTVKQNYATENIFINKP